MGHKWLCQEEEKTRGCRRTRPALSHSLLGVSCLLKGSAWVDHLEPILKAFSNLHVAKLLQAAAVAKQLLQNVSQWPATAVCGQSQTCRLLQSL